MLIHIESEETHTHTYIYIYIYIYILAQSAGAVEYTNCNSECHGYDTKQSDDEVPVMLGLWGMWSTTSLPLLPGPLRPRMVAPDKVSKVGDHSRG